MINKVLCVTKIKHNLFNFIFGNNLFISRDGNMFRTDCSINGIKDFNSETILQISRNGNVGFCYAEEIEIGDIVIC
jgi:hypothetical protein